MARQFEVDADLEDDLELDYEDGIPEGDDYLREEDFKALGINPMEPTTARPGSEEKVLMLSARYAAGLPLWHNSDCYDHGPRESELMGSLAHLRPQPVAQPEFVEAADVEDDDEVE